MKRRTKIVCTLGPATSTKERIAELIEAGMNVARINCSHGDWETRRQWIEWIRELSPTVGPIGILADIQGPKFRLGVLQASRLEVANGQEVTVGDDVAAMLPIHQPEILRELSVGDKLLLGDGEVSIKIVREEGKHFVAKVLDGGTVKTKQGVTLVGKVFHTDCLTPKDLKDLDEALAADVDFIALSYVHIAEDMEKLRALTATKNPDVKLCAKIETRAAIKNIDAILEVSDLIMVARGDMGLQMDIEEVPLAQKRIIAKCSEHGKPVITATQMLESMIVNARPTRAEATDVANAILDGTDAVMLSGETAAGSHPIAAVETMSRIAERTEAAYDHDRPLREFMDDHVGRTDHTVAVAASVAQLSALIKPKAVLTTTTTGQTTRLVSKFRPKVPILCATWSAKTYHQMSVIWGAEAVMIGLPATTDEIVAHAFAGFRKVKRLKEGDQVIVTSGVPAGVPGSTNLILTQTV